MTDNHGEFGPYLDALIRESGLSQREVAKRAGIDEGTIRAYLRGYVQRRGVKITTPPTVLTVIKLADALDVERAALLRVAGLEMPRRFADRKNEPQSATPTAIPTDVLLETLKRRMEELEDAAKSARLQLPPVRLTDQQIRQRGRISVRINVIADEARELGDDTAADALCALVAALDAQLEAAMAQEVSEAQDRRPANG